MSEKSGGQAGGNRRCAACDTELVSHSHLEVCPTCNVPLRSQVVFPSELSHGSQTVDQRNDRAAEQDNHRQADFYRSLSSSSDEFSDALSPEQFAAQEQNEEGRKLQVTEHTCSSITADKLSVNGRALHDVEPSQNEPKLKMSKPLQDAKKVPSQASRKVAGDSHHNTASFPANTESSTEKDVKLNSSAKKPFKSSEETLKRTQKGYGRAMSSGNTGASLSTPIDESAPLSTAALVAGSATTTPASSTGTYPDELLPASDEHRKRRSKVNTTVPLMPLAKKEVPGCHIPEDRCITVVFHTFVHLPSWGCIENPKVCIRFGERDLGNWKHDFPLDIVSSEAIECCEVKGKVKIALQFLKNQDSVAYKYTVFNSSIVENVDCYEYIHDFRIVRNRSLKLTSTEYRSHSGGVFHKYDTLVYPKQVWSKQQGGVIQSIVDLGRRFIHPQRSEDTFQPLKLSQACDLCLRMFLTTYKTRLLNDMFATGTTASEVVSMIGRIHESLRTPCFILQHSWDECTLPQNLNKTMLKWLEDCVTTLQMETVSRPTKFFAAAVIAMCTQKLIYFKPETFVVEVLETLALSFTEQLVETKLDKHSSDELADAVKALLVCLVNNQKSEMSQYDWLMSISLHNLLTKKRFPCTASDTTLTKVMQYWDDSVNPDRLRLVAFKRKVNTRFFEDCYGRFKTALSLDVHFLQDFITLCSSDAFHELLLLLPFFMSVSWLSHVVSTENYCGDSQVTKWIQLMGVIASVDKNDPSLESLICDVKATQGLFARITKKARRTSGPHVICLTKSLELMFQTLHELDHLQIPEDHRAEVMGTREVIFNELSENLWNWIIDVKVIGGSLFGGSVSGFSTRVNSELQIWQSLLSIPCSRDIEKPWHAVVNKLLRSRILESGVALKHKVQLVRMLLKYADLHPILKDIFFEAGTQAIEQLMTQPNEARQTYFDQLAEEPSHFIGNLCGQLLKKECPGWSHDAEHNEVSLTSLLTWTLWPNFIGIYLSASAITDGFDDVCGQTCECALSSFYDICHKISRRSVTKVELTLVEKNLQQIKKLCQAVSKDGHGNTKPNFDDVNDDLQERLKEMRCFELHRQRLEYFCSQVSSIQDLDELREKLCCDFDSFELKQLCTPVDGKIKVIQFEMAEPLSKFVKHFSIMLNRHYSTIVHQLWRNHLVSSQCKSVTDFYPKVWRPTFENCQNILRELYNQSMHLSEVDKLFNINRYQKDLLQTQLLKLYEGLKSCSEIDEGSSCSFVETYLDGAWIHLRVQQISHYWDLCKCHEAANLFLSLKDVLQLNNGDFTTVERVSTEVGSSMENLLLSNIDDKLVKDSEQLGTIISDPLKLECLREFAKCQDLVIWIQSISKDVNDLQNFVTVALATAAGGEDNLTHDKLSHLGIVGSGFQSLIYKLSPKAGYDELCIRCNMLWEALKTTPELPELLYGCKGQLDWYKAVKDTQGSVEVTSFGQMGSILKFGSFYIGLTTQLPVYSIHNVICLNLIDTEKKLQKNSYTLDELRDLESKLVLIVGSKSERRREVERYIEMLQRVCHIAELLVSLRLAGNINYISWSFTFFCCSPRAVKELSLLSDKMAKELFDWNTTVEQARDEYYELNYFTTQQLLSLRQELGKMQDPSSSAALPETSNVMMMLYSISPIVTPRKVQDTMLGYLAQREEQMAALEEPSQELLQISDEQSPTRTSEMTDLPLRLEDSVVHKKLSVDQLNDEEKSAYTNITVMYAYETDIVLLAIAECGTDERSIAEFCVSQDLEKVLNIQESESESEGDSENEVSCSAEDDITQADETFEDASRYIVLRPEPVDEHHSAVIKLIEAGYSMNESIRAIEVYKEPVRAMDYLDSMDTESDEEEANSTNEDTNPSSKVLLSPTSCSSQNILARESWAKSNEAKRFEQAILTMPPEKDIATCFSLQVLGFILHQLKESLSDSLLMRHFPVKLQEGSPNLIVTPPDKVLTTALALYMIGDGDGNMDELELPPLPTHEEVLICSEETTSEEVTLLWRRAVNDPGYNRVFCLVHAEKLTYHACDKSLQNLFDYCQGEQGYRLVIICSNKDEDRSHMISLLDRFRRNYTLLPQPQQYREYFRRHFTSIPQNDMTTVAATVDIDSSCVRVVRSTRSGMGKSLYIERMAEKLMQQSASKPLLTIPLHGPVIAPEVVIGYLNDPRWLGINSNGAIIHYDIAPNVLSEADTLLFCLLILRALSDCQGRVWRAHPSQLYAIEVTVPTNEDALPEAKTLALLDLLPVVDCISPKEVKQLENLGMHTVSLDVQEFSSKPFQRAYQYLKCYESDATLLDKFTYKSVVEGRSEECLELLLRHCGLKNPSWSEIFHFVKFLDVQLQSCEQSDFCNESLTGPGGALQGFKSFVVTFMLTMSQDFATSSLKGELKNEDDVEDDDSEVNEIQQYEIHERRLWEQSFHPYIFFNQDGHSLSFVGFRVARNGNLIDPRTEDVIEESIMSKELFWQLAGNGVNFGEDYRNWSKDFMITKLALVMGLKNISDSDPDSSYVLTSDNLIKMLAIHMRFRCGIPVVIMGETGCGKTRLIRYMCDLARMSMPSVAKNLLIMKMHGGINEEDIISFIGKAEVIAVKNSESNLDTVVFFDEANTTDAIGLIKEVMCDRRLNGKPITSNLKFVAACNPYRRHDTEMINKLESAGLGFYKGATSKQVIGKIPLHHLVYRVLDLPPSMRPLVYDFGQLKDTTEESYTHQIVSNHVLRHTGLQHNDRLVVALTKVLAWSQWYMREKRKDECSFVSLRDVERTMIVFEYFFERMSLLGPLMDKKAKQLAAERAKHNDPFEDCDTFRPDNVTSTHSTLPDQLSDEEKVASATTTVLGADESDSINLDFGEQQEQVPDQQSDEESTACANTTVLGAEEHYYTDSCEEQEQSDSEGSEESYDSVPATVEGLPWTNDDSLLMPNENTLTFIDCFENSRSEVDSDELLSHSSSVTNEWASIVTKSLILALSVCYDARMQDRSDYEENVVQQFMEPLHLLHGVEEFRSEVRWCQEVLLDNMEVGENIARNAALRENVFMMAVCIDLRIPLFLVGKPGSSKSLAKAIVANSMHGGASNNEHKLLKQFKQVHMFSYQCSQISAPGSVIEVFKTAKRFQKDRDIKNFVSVVVLDEVGLAEASPKLPLKALHPLLEDGTEGADEVVDRDHRVGFVGISNWALDPAKMNRGIMIIRGDPDAKELEESARGISCNDKLEPFFKPLAEAYYNICEKQLKQFFGLRDFYSLIKMLHWLSDETDMAPTSQQLEHAIRRNFGGLQSGSDLGGNVNFDPIEEFTKKLRHNQYATDPDLTHIKEERRKYVKPDCSQLGMIRTSIITKETSWHGENRYLLFLTENYAALEILRHFLRDAVGFDSDAAVNDELETTEPFILFGSSFPKDKDYTQVCRNINRIKICMETGRTVILLNLENLYESLYDVLNQYYIYHGGSRYVDLGLQTNRVKCRVHNDFKLILIAEKLTVYERFPTALINRLEKHFVVTSSILEQWQLVLLEQFKQWVVDFSHVETGGHTFHERDAFVGYQKDTPASVIFQASNMLKNLKCPNPNKQVDALANFTCVRVIGDNCRKMLMNEPEGSHEWTQAVLQLCQYLLLNIAAPEALIRLEKTPLAEHKNSLQIDYSTKQHHKSVFDFVHCHLTEVKDTCVELLMQVATFSHLLSVNEVDEIVAKLGFDGQHYLAVLLQKYDTELDFTNDISFAFEQSEDREDFILVIQCDSGHLNSDLIAYARYRVYDERVRFQRQQKVSDNQRKIHIVFIVHLPRNMNNSLFVGFQGEPWISGYVDDLRLVDHTSLTVYEAMGKRISELFSPNFNEEADVLSSINLLFRSHSLDDLVGIEEQIIPENAQCWRLRDCIQAAASRLQDTERTKERSTKRVVILLDCIPQDRELFDETTFYGILVTIMYHLLTMRDEINLDDDWVLSEALDAKKLHNGGTFRNVLSRRLDEVVVPLFSEIIAMIDRYYNLDLVYQADWDSPLSQFWLAMFQYTGHRSHIDSFIMPVLQKSRQQVHGLGAQISEDFKTRLPFSWIVKECVDAHWDNVKAIAENRTQLRLQLKVSLETTAIGEILIAFNEHCEDLYCRYLHDFVRIIHQCHYKDEISADIEYKLVEQALDAVVRCYCAHAPEDTLISRITALHVEYQLTETNLFWFGQLMSHNPGVLVTLDKMNTVDENEMVLHLYALKASLDSRLELPLNKDEAAHYEWLNVLRRSQQAVLSILSSAIPTVMECDLRKKWHVLRAIQLYMEHVALQYENLILYTRRLHIRLCMKDNLADFHKAETISKILTFLQSHEKGKIKNKRQIKRSCDKLFAEIVSVLCFSGPEPPEILLIELLMTMVFKERCGDAVQTSELSPYKRSDNVPIIRSFLLQLLLEMNTEAVKDQLNKYFKQSQKVLNGTDQELCLLCIKCFEDALCKEYSHKEPRVIAGAATRMLIDSQNVLINEGFKPTIPHMEAIAQIRFALSVVSNVLSTQTRELNTADSLPVLPQAHHILLQAASNICGDLNVNVIDITGSEDTTGPVIYLLKLLVRRFGVNVLMEVANEHDWIIPCELRQKEVHTQLPFVIYNPQYSSLRRCVKAALLCKNFEELQDATKDLQPHEVVPLLLVLYETVTLSRASVHLGDDIPMQTMGEFNDFISGIKALRGELQWTAKALIANEQGGPLAQMRVSPQQPLQCKSLSAFVVHTAVVFLSRQNVDVLLPFANMLIHPAELIESYFPAMPEDFLLQAHRVLKEGKFHKCPRGHQYLIGDCGGAQTVGKCIECQAPVGGYNYTLQEGNAVAAMTDSNFQGYTLGKPESRGSDPVAERSLSPAACTVMRALIHAALVWTSCNNENDIGDLAVCIKADVPPKHYPEFFWLQLERDVELLQKATGKNSDECLILLHMLLKDIVQKVPPACGVMNNLLDTQSRTQWEALFDETYIHPLLNEAENKISEGMDHILHHEEQEPDKLMYLIYEKVKLKGGKIDPHLWSYRPHITLEHLALGLAQQNLKEKCKVLQIFLDEEHNLRATQYLPDIVRLQQYLYNTYNYRCDRKEAKEITIGELRKKKGVTRDLQRLLASLRSAWMLVKEKLKDQARFRVHERYLKGNMGDETPLELLIPTTEGGGICTTALVWFLVFKHNEFIERCRIIIKEREKSTSLSELFWKGYQIPLSHLRHCHLLDYEHQLMSIILTHCHYSLEVGEAHEVNFDFPALEKHILDRFIHGKPQILLQIPQVCYKKDVCTAETFTAVRQKVVPQEKLTTPAKQEILAELCTVDRLRQNLDIVDIILGFVSSAGCQAGKDIGKYIEKVLKMKKGELCKPALDHCKMGHIISLWETLSVELAKKLTIDGEKPFDTLRIEFQEELSTEDKGAMEGCLNSFNLDDLLCILLEFIETFVRHQSPDCFADNWPLGDTLNVFLDGNGFPPVENLPDTIELAKIVSTWDYVVHYQRKKGGHRIET